MHTNPFSAIQQLWNQRQSLVLSDPNSKQDISEEYKHLLFSASPSPPSLTLTLSPHNNQLDSMCLISISIVPSSWTLFLLFFYSCIVTTHAPFPLQTLFFSTPINMPHMYQYSLSLILKLFLSYSFVLSSQSLNLVISANSLWTSTLMLNPSYAELSCIFDSLTLHLMFAHLVYLKSPTPRLRRTSQLCVAEFHGLNSVLFTLVLTPHLPTSWT